MNEMKPISNFKNNLYQVAIILLLAYAAFSSAMKDLDRLQQVAGNVQTATANGLGELAKVYSATRSMADGAEVARVPESSIDESPRVAIIAAGGSVTLAGFDRKSATELTSDSSFANRTHSKTSCPLTKRELPKAIEKDLKWTTVAQLPKRVELLDYQISPEHDAELPRSFRRGPRIRAIINRLPLKAGKKNWSNVGEFKSLSDVIGFGLKVANTEAVELERRTDTNDEAPHYLFDFKRGASDSEKDDSETQE